MEEAEVVTGALTGKMTLAEPAAEVIVSADEVAAGVAGEADSGREADSSITISPGDPGDSG